MSAVNFFKSIESASGSNAKLAILKHANATEKLILKLAYEPLWMYGIKKFPWFGSGDTNIEHIVHKVENVCMALAHGALSGDAAKAEVMNLTNDLTFKDAKLFKNILLKDLRCGISVTTINKAIPGLISVFGAMLAKTYNNEMPAEGLYMSLKLDGLRAIFKDGKLYTRNGHVIQGVQHITDLIPKSNSYDGELMIPGEHFQVSSGKIRSFENCPTAVYHIFDIPNHGGRFEGRVAEMKYESISYATDDCIKFVKHSLVKDPESVDRNFAKAIAAGYEGLVLKTVDHFYQPKRSSDWLKMKLVESEDLKVIGFFEGQGKYTEMLGGIIVDRAGVAVKVGSGFSDDLRWDIWNNQDKYLGQTAEVLYHEVTPDGSLRHPRLKCFRIDK